MKLGAVVAVEINGQPAVPGIVLAIREVEETHNAPLLGVVVPYITEGAGRASSGELHDVINVADDPDASAPYRWRIAEPGELLAEHTPTVEHFPA